MDSEGIKERFMTNMWLLFSECLATEALYNVFTRPTMGSFRKAFLDLLLPVTELDIDNFSARTDIDHDGTKVSLELRNERWVIFIEPKFYGSVEKSIASMAGILKKEYLLADQKMLCILGMVDRQGEVAETQKALGASHGAIEVRYPLWAQILGVFAGVRGESQRSTGEKDVTIEPSQIDGYVSTKH
jgi:hypothetical protein